MNRSPTTSQSLADAAFAFASTLPEFGYAEIAVKMGVTEDHVRKIVRKWKTADLLDDVRSGHGLRSAWKVKDGAKLALAVKARSPEQNIWTAMRQLKSFSPRELAAHASTEDTPITLEVAQDYCRALLGAGYLVVTRKAIPGKQLAIYRLTKNTGPRPPREKRVRAVVDDNTETVTLIGSGIGGGQ
jgi:hypothetical protein